MQSLKIIFVCFVVLFGLCSSCFSESWISKIKDGKNWRTVHATRIGLIGKITASGERIEHHAIFVALPHKKALGKQIAVKYKNRVIVCEVKDVGPHSIADSYVFTGKRPLAEQGRRIPSRWGRPRNKAGIDLSDGLWRELGLSINKGMIKITWKFLS